MQPEMADRLAGLIAAVPGLTKRDVVLTGLSLVLEACEEAPERALQILRIGAFESRGKVSLGVNVPLDLDHRLGEFVARTPGVSRRDVAMAGIDLVISRCEKINGGPFFVGQTSSRIGKTGN